MEWKEQMFTSFAYQICSVLLQHVTFLPEFLSDKGSYCTLYSIEKSKSFFLLSAGHSILGDIWDPNKKEYFMVLNLYPELSIIVITSTLHKVLDLHTY